MTDRPTHPSDRIVLCGASGTLGRAIALQLAANGASLALLGRDLTALQGLLASLPRPKGFVEHLALHCDLTDVRSTETALESAARHQGGLDVFITAAGAAQGGIFWELDDASWQRNLEVKLFGNLRALRAVTEKMVAAKHGRIVLIAGNSAHKPDPRMLPGAAANAALLAIVQGLAEELRPHGVTISVVNPGPVRSSRLDTLMKTEAERRGITVQEAEARFLERSGVRELATPEQIAAQVALLAAKAATG